VGSDYTVLHLHDFTYGLATPALSYIVASIGALLGLRAVTRARASQGASRSRWLLLAGSAMGSIGIWAMGFAGLLGFAVAGETTRYSLPVTILSLLVAVVTITAGLLVVGFIGMALWRLSEALYGAPGSGSTKASKRLSAFARAVIYAVIAYGVLKYALGEGSPKSSDAQSVDLTATLLKYPGGQALVVVIGLAFIGGGLYLAYQAWRKEFRRDLELGQMRRRTRRVRLLRIGDVGVPASRYCTAALQPGSGPWR